MDSILNIKWQLPPSQAEEGRGPLGDTFKCVTAALLITGKSWKQMSANGGWGSSTWHVQHGSESEQSPLLQHVWPARPPH